MNNIIITLTYIIDRNGNVYDVRDNYKLVDKASYTLKGNYIVFKNINNVKKYNNIKKLREVILI